MDIADNILAHHLRHVYFIAGTNCGGKTTMADCLARRHNLAVYHADDEFLGHKAIANPFDQPAMTRHFIDYEWFFNRPVEEYAKWIFDAGAEELGMVLMDLARLPQGKPVVVDVLCSPEALGRVAAHDRVIFLLPAPGMSRAEYFRRQDKQDMYRCIMGLKDPDKTLEHVLDTVEHIARVESARAQQSGMKCIVRDNRRTVEETAVLVERHFGLA